MTMGEITLVLGGARSGKSTFAEELALSRKEHVTYLATADCRDGEMKKRIEIHKSRRPSSWSTWEGGPRELPRAVAAASGLLLNVFTDPFLGYFRNVYIFGQEYTVAQALTKIAGGVTFVNSVASTVCVVVLYLALRPALERAGLLPKGETN